MEDAVDLLDEARDTALARTAVYQQGLRNYHARRVRSRTFNVGDLVVRLKPENMANWHHRGKDHILLEKCLETGRSS